MMKRLFGVLALCMIAVVGLTACGGGEKEPEYADDQAMAVIAKGLEARSDYLDKQDDTSTTTALIGAIDAELEVDKELQNKPFQDSKLQEQVLAYINVLEESKKVVEDYPQTSVEYYTKWDEVYNKRTAMLKTFVDDYGLTVNDKLKPIFDEMIANGGAAQKQIAAKEALENIVSSLKFEVVDDGYGNFTYQATGENTTEYDFTNVSLVLGLYDEEGVRANEAYCNTNSWAAGEKVRFEAFGQVNATEIRPEVQYYTLGE